MIVLSDTHPTDRTVLRPCRLRQLTSLTVIVLTIDFSVIVLFVLLDVATIVFFCDLTRFGRTGLVVDPKTDSSQDVSKDYLVGRH